jgi:hypothetical protein
MVTWRISERGARIAAVLLVFAAVCWGFYIHLPTLNDGYLNAGDDHVHVAFANELARIWQGEGRFLGWSQLYAAGSPIFILRPPGFYAVTAATHFLTGLTVEESLKLVVLFGFSLFPVSVFLGSRLLGMGLGASLGAALLSPLAISLWGHTIDAYQYLGVYKQQLAILLFPLAVGSLWQLFKTGKHGLIFAIVFPFMFITHPYIAYCFTLLAPCMLISLAALEPDWNWKATFVRTLLWSIPAVCLVGIWLIPFVTSPEAQVFDPYLSRRNYFDVIVSTTAETLRQLFLGGIFDTTRFAGPFGGTDWIVDAEWGWIKNDQFWRFPVITAFAVIGWIVVLVRCNSPVRAFLGLSFLLSLVIFMGPDDFPLIDYLPFAKQFQNIHGIFMLDWAAIMLGGFSIGWMFRKAAAIRRESLRIPMVAVMTIGVAGALASGYTERTVAAKRLIDVISIYTDNGKLAMKPGIFREWAEFQSVVDQLEVGEAGNVMGLPQLHNDSVLYNILPLMADRLVFICGFEVVGGIYDLMLHKFRGPLRDNYPIQKLFNVRYVVNSPFHRKVPMTWHENTELLFKTNFWEMVRIKGEFGDFELLPTSLAGFFGTEREWQFLMERWLRRVRDGAKEIPPVVNFSNSGLSAEDEQRIAPLIKLVVLGDGAEASGVLKDVEQLRLEGLAEKPVEKILLELKEKEAASEAGKMELAPLAYDVVRADRKEEVFKITVTDDLAPVLFKRMYYRGWQAFLDNSDTPIYRISPGLQMVLVPAGTHEVSWRYTGPNNWRWSVTGFWIALASIAALVMFGMRRPVPVIEKQKGYDEAGKTGSGLVLRNIPVMISLVFIGVFVVKVISEAYFRMPVTVRPQQGQVLSEGTEDFFWNNVIGIPKDRQRFRLEVATDPEFQDILVTRDATGSKERYQGIFKPGGTYYYRIRLEVDGKPFKWSRPIVFYGPEKEL